MRSCPVTNKSLSKVGMCELHVIAVLIIENSRRFPVRAPLIHGSRNHPPANQGASSTQRHRSETNLKSGKFAEALLHIRIPPPFEA